MLASWPSRSSIFSCYLSIQHFFCGSATAFSKINCDDSAFNPLTVLPGWLGHRIAQSICLSAYVVFSIQTADQSLFGVASRWVNGWDRTIRKVKKSRTPTNKLRTRLCNNNKFKCLWNGAYIYPSQGLVMIDGDLIHELRVGQFLSIQIQAQSHSIII